LCAARSRTQAVASMIRSGIAPLDVHLGGVAAGRIHILAGGVGVGKTSACLHFLQAGLEAGEGCVLVTADRPSDLHNHATHLGMDLGGALRDGRLAALRFRPEFGRRLAAAATCERPIEDLRSMIASGHQIRRIAIDPVTAFLADGTPSGGSLAALVAFLDTLGATTLLTCVGPVAAAADRRLDPLLEWAATVVELARAPDGAFEMTVARARNAAAPREPLRFTIERSVGLVAARRMLAVRGNGGDHAGGTGLPASHDEHPPAEPPPIIVELPVL
jgi:KaiC/GvpD/RAD55 family RecA-like ATPase